ncbi:T9SS type A sorting domain-containing protein, partial [Cutibacterium acnes]
TTDTAAAVYYPAAGNYTITLTVRDKTNDTTAVYYQSVRVRDMAKKQQDAKVSIFPNPSTGSFSLAYDEALFANPRIKVYNQLGKLIADQYVTPGRVDLPALSNGMYFISFYGETYQKMLKLVIQN